MTTIKKLEECHLTVLSQSFYAFWSKDNYHENVAGMMAAGSFQPIQCLVKDDVFLAQPLDQDDTASLSSHSSSSTQDHKFISPCLSPVSSPTQFLSNHETLFDGIEDQLLDPVECDKTPKRSRQEDTVSHQKRRKKTAHRKQKVQASNNSSDNNSSDNTSQLIEKQDETDTTLFQHLTESGIHWCRYCGTTEGVNWRPGPWGKRTLCNKHGCDYKGYGLASRQPRLDLSAFKNETLSDRIRPVIQQFCIVCQSPEEKGNHLIVCGGGCSRAYHQTCHTPVINVNQSDPVRWYCNPLCKENRKRNKVVVELPRKHMPLLHLLKKDD